jgi:hypothetical protein
MCFPTWLNVFAFEQDGCILVFDQHHAIEPPAIELPSIPTGARLETKDLLGVLNREFLTTISVRGLGPVYRFDFPIDGSRSASVFRFKSHDTVPIGKGAMWWDLALKVRYDNTVSLYQQTLEKNFQACA